MGKLFKTSRYHCICLYVIYYARAWKHTYELLSLQAKIIRPPPSPLSLHCKDRKFSSDFDSIPKVELKTWNFFQYYRLMAPPLVTHSRSQENITSHGEYWTTSLSTSLQTLCMSAHHLWITSWLCSSIQILSWKARIQPSTTPWVTIVQTVFKTKEKTLYI